MRRQLADFGDDRKAIREFGFDVVYRLCERLIAEGVPAMHFYSMNKVEPNKRLVEALGLVSDELVSNDLNSKTLSSESASV